MKNRQKENIKKRLKDKNTFFLKKKAVLSKILKNDDMKLSIPCDDVTPSDDIPKIVSDLKEVLNFSDTGIGMSASQIGIYKKVFVIDPHKRKEYTTFINPIITSEEGSETMQEGCLSYPDIFKEVKRASKITVEYFNENFEKQIETFKGITARVILHEYDHLLGVCIVGK